MSHFGRLVCAGGFPQASMLSDRELLGHWVEMINHQVDRYLILSLARFWDISEQIRVGFVLTIKTTDTAIL